MMQCKDCEFYRRSPTGEITFACDPFHNIKEEQCLVKWQLIKINQMVSSYQATLEYYRKLAPMQEKMFKVMERELDDINEGDKWRIADEDEPETPNENGQDDDWPQPPPQGR